MDIIHIRRLTIPCIIGVKARERRIRQDVVVSISLHGDFRKAGRRDRLADAVDYAAIRARVVALVKSSRFHLIEALAQKVAELCLAAPRVAAVKVTVEKPKAFSGQGDVAVDIHRTRAKE